jgi:hypothetical protein
MNDINRMRELGCKHVAKIILKIVRCIIEGVC